ncbi:hypothetical protein IQ269_25085 [Tychonema sp. LEGE 07199]|uniref:hypothetical protein n=1 Tax=unclassified Tychonema TaxID=2642144 RepID=UPI0018830A39|nr:MULTISPECIES: hypothetical protein [unclassified Tychonema]MBE9123984.1 hypothetical protein [Tychonema sp. LEGE 07199]MBE9131566.1 hypothetical protein [Tychonema sp. LEGE 07196]
MPLREGRRKFGNEQCTGCNGCNGCKSVGRRKKEEGRRKKEEGRRKKEEERGKKLEAANLLINLPDRLLISPRYQSPQSGLLFLVPSFYSDQLANGILHRKIKL